MLRKAKSLDGNFFGLRARGIPQPYAEVVRSGKSVTDGVKFIQKPLSLMNLARQVRELLDVENSADASNSPQ